MANEQEINGIASELQLQQSRGEAIKQQIQQMQGNLLEIGGTIEAIKNLKKAKGDTLVPIGSGVLISCPKPDPEKVIISIGANVMLHKKPEDAIKMLEERQKSVMQAINIAQGDLGEVVKAIDSLTNRASLIAAQEERKNVRPSQE